MAFITQLEVVDLAGRAGPYRVSLRPDVNVFFGVNGSGKTSLLKILHSALSLDGSILAAVPFGKAEVYVQSANRLAALSIEKSRLQPQKRPLSLASLARAGALEQEPGGWSVEPQQPLPKEGFSHAYLPTTRLVSGPQDPPPTANLFTSWVGNRPTGEEQLDTQFANILETLWRDYYFGILWRVRRAQEQGLANLLVDTLSPQPSKGPASREDIQTTYGRVRSFLTRQGGSQLSKLGDFEDFASQYESDDRLRTVVGRVDRVEQAVEEIMTPSNRLEELVRRLFTNKTVQFAQQGLSVEIGGQTIGLASLSSGEKHVLRLFVEAVQTDRGCILIDEPELSLHVDWQRILLASIRGLAPHSQLIVATHSPEIMAELGDEHIFRL